MSELIWNAFLTKRDKAVFGKAGYGARHGFGKRPAVLIIDVNYNFCGDRREPIKAIQKLLEAARSKGLPVIYSTGTARDDNWDSGSWAWKISRNAERPSSRGTKSCRRRRPVSLTNCLMQYETDRRIERDVQPHLRSTSPKGDFTCSGH